MVNGNEPNYICMDSRALALAKHLPDSERLEFYDSVYAAYIKLLNGEKDFVFPDTMLGNLIMQAVETMINGFNTYMKRVNANPSGTTNTQDSMGSQRVAKGSQSNQDQSLDQITNDQISQIKSQLQAEGYTEIEIDDALKKCYGKSIKDLSAYLRTTINNQRNKMKRLPSHDFPQRDYSKVNDELMEQTERDVAQFLKAEQAAGTK